MTQKDLVTIDLCGWVRGYDFVRHVLEEVPQMRMGKLSEFRDRVYGHVLSCEHCFSDAENSLLTYLTGNRSFGITDFHSNLTYLEDGHRFCKESMRFIPSQRKS